MPACAWERFFYCYVLPLSQPVLTVTVSKKCLSMFLAIYCDPRVDPALKSPTSSLPCTSHRVVGFRLSFSFLFSSVVWVPLRYTVTEVLLLGATYGCLHHRRYQKPWLRAEQPSAARFQHRAEPTAEPFTCTKTVP